MDDGEWNRFVGEWGEKLAVKHLRFEGLKPLYRNFRAPKGGEVDIVCRDGEFLVFVEVKTRRSTDFGRPVRAVDKAKQLLITKGAMAWLRELNHPDVKFRFDVVEVVLEEGKPPQIEHLRNVFQMPEPFRYG
jgi:putative endonuclease